MKNIRTIQGILFCFVGLTFGFLSTSIYGNLGWTISFHSIFRNYFFWSVNGAFYLSLSISFLLCGLGLIIKNKIFFRFGNFAIFYVFCALVYYCMRQDFLKIIMIIMGIIMYLRSYWLFAKSVLVTNLEKNLFNNFGFKKNISIIVATFIAIIIGFTNYINVHYSRVLSILISAIPLWIIILSLFHRKLKTKYVNSIDNNEQAPPQTNKNSGNLLSNIKKKIHNKAIVLFVILALIVSILLFFKLYNYNCIPRVERKALIALYNSTGGDNWWGTAGWKRPPLHRDGFSKPGTEGDWDGIRVLDKHVIDIQISGSSIKGNIPKELRHLPKLKYLSIFNTQITGSIPPELGELSNLVRLSLENNNLSGSIPPELASFSELYALNLSYNRLNGDIPKKLANLSNLLKLELQGNQLTGNIPKELANLTKIERMNLSKNRLTGNIPKEIFILPNLEDFILSYNYLTGKIPEEICNLKKIEFLDLSHNELEGGIPSKIGDSGCLRLCDLSNNKLTGIIPYNIWDMPISRSGCTLNFSHNQLTGNIIPENNKLLAGNNFNSLNLSHNQLTGSIPYQLKFLPISYLYLNNNNLSGTIPKELGNLSRLNVIHLENNKLTGNIPKELGNLSMLKSLSLSGNTLKGNIPLSLGGLDNIYEIIKKGGINSFDKSNKFLLMRAIFFDQIEIAKLLINNGADVNEKKETFRQTPLILAVSRNNINLAKLLLEKGAEVNASDYHKKTSLFIACSNNSIDLAKLLIENGADVNVKDRNNNTALMVASTNKNLLIVKLLLENGADVNYKDEYGQTALMKTYDKEIMKLLSDRQKETQ